jgi:hypothetical protein
LYETKEVRPPAWFSTWKDTWEAAYPCTGDAMNAEECDILRDLLGPTLFRPVAVDPAWRTRDVLAVANGIYQERAFERRPILADALEEVGAAADLVGHLRGPGPHVRGCWCVEAILGRQ